MMTDEELKRIVALMQVLIDTDPSTVRQLAHLIVNPQFENHTAIMLDVVRKYHDVETVYPLVHAVLAAREPAPKTPTPEPSDTAGPVMIYTDGACSGNPGPGGWGVIVGGEGGGEMSGPCLDTTNNRMEMTAMLVALQYCLNRGGEFLIRSDSKYVLDGLQEWLAGWKARGWRGASGKAVLNQDLWEALDLIYTQIKASDVKVTLEYVKGHSKELGNDAVDELAVHARLMAAGLPLTKKNRPDRPTLPFASEGLTL